MSDKPIPRSWQPGERAIYTDWAGKRSFAVTVIGYSRSKFSHGRLLLVRGDDGKRFTIHRQFLAPAGEGEPSE
ncbi:MAG: hypothetical protein JW900_07410 [Anaerolineae bacterium]|nr:hypothetical protein [Anaerolineae bacterium]